MSEYTHKESMRVRMGLDFGFDANDIPKYWLAGDAFKTRMMDTVQATFPDGERYFISTVQAFKDEITDPAMKKEVRDFSMQEGQHGKVHTDFNRHLDRQGIDTRVVTNYIEKISARRLKWFSARYNVALTAAFEHFTAMMADLFFAEKSILTDADPRVRAMMAWHAIEEMEHRAVAFDVMQKVAKVGYFQRVLAMTHATCAFVLVSSLLTWAMLRMDGYSRWQCLRLSLSATGWLLTPGRGIIARLLPMVARYYKPGFHPNDVPAVHNYDAWLSGYSEAADPLQAAEAMWAAAR